MPFQIGHPPYSGVEKGWFKKGQTPWNKGKPMSDRTREKLSGALKNQFKQGRIVWNKNLTKELDKRVKQYVQKQTEIRRTLVSEGRWPVWNKGLGELNPYGYEFTEELKERIRKRDNFVCQICYKTREAEVQETGQDLEVHHIDFDKTNNNSDNLLILCTSCHSSITNYVMKKKGGTKHRVKNRLD